MSFGLSMRAIFVLTGALMLSACAGTMLPGNIYSTDGKVMQFEIEKSRGSGAVKAVDTSTGEQFAGNYVGVLPTVTQTSTVIVSGSVVTSGFGVDSISSNMANATAFLKGDKGTMLNCAMEIQASVISPHGIGGCTDNSGRKYRLQF
jgi:hypothetical protein